MSSDARPTLHPDGPSTRPSAVEALRGHRLPGAQPGPGPAAPVGPDATTQAVPVPAGNRVGPYTLVDKLGEGGMGVVYRATDPRGGDVAVKVLRPHIAHDAGARHRLGREVSTLGRIRHRNVAPVLDADVDGPRPYLVTQYVPGPSLDQVVTERGPLSTQQLVVLGRGLAEALRAIHAAGVVHRDVKPGNVLMLGDDPVLIDFGIAQVADEVRLTMTGMVMGTPGYLSPEVVEGGAVDSSTDWWGWAATLAFAASGKAPFGRGPMPAVLDRVIRGQADLSGVDERLRPLLASALSPVPQERPSAQAVLDQLAEYARGGHTTGIPTRAAAAPSVPSPAAAPATAPWQRGATVAAPQPATAPWQREATVAAAPPPLAHTQAQVPPPRTQVQPVRRPDPTAAMPAPAAGAFGAGPFGVPAQGGFGTDRAQSPFSLPPQAGLGGPVSPAAQAQQAYPQPARPAQDPRIGQTARTGTLTALLAALVALALVMPGLAILLLVAWTVVARWVDKAVTSMVMRRHEAGPRRSDGVVALLVSPWHGLTALLSTLTSLILPALVGAVGAVTTALALSMYTGRSPRVDQGLPVAVGLLLGAWVLWWGPGGPSTRRGSRSIVRRALPAGPVASVVVALCLGVAALAVAGWTLKLIDVTWWPFVLDLPWSVNDWIPAPPA